MGRNRGLGHGGPRSDLVMHCTSRDQPASSWITGNEESKHAANRKGAAMIPVEANLNSGKG
eukprot:14319330-Alexandrium_andersonii.AAC.1